MEVDTQPFKYPTVLRYDIHSKLVVEWGDGALAPLKSKTHSERCLAFKLFLCQKLVARDINSGDRETPIWERQPICKNVKEVVSEFLSCVYNEVKEEIDHRSRELGVPYRPQDLVFLVSHPQCFEKDDMERFMGAVNDSMIIPNGHTCKLENKSEMAGRYILGRMKEHERNDLATQPCHTNAILVCTAGGSSVVSLL